MRIVSLLALAALVCATGAGAREPAVLVSLEQTGGFAGIERGLAVHRSGKVVADGMPVKTARLTPARLQALRDALVRARFASLARVYESEQPIADGYVYRITYAGRSVRIEEEATLPPRLERPFELLTGLIRS